MYPDPMLRRTAIHALHLSGLSEAFKREIEELLEAYETACDLTRRRQTHRTNHHIFKALTLERDLHRKLKGL